MKKICIITLLVVALCTLALLAMPEENSERLVAPMPAAVVAVGKGVIDVEGGIVHVAASPTGHCL